MRWTSVSKWLLLLASSGVLFQVGAGCRFYPGQEAINGALATGTQSLINGVIGLYVKAWTNQFLHV